jgi:serine phosphatase RsbU (regulator of sigma subunit)
MEEGHSTPVFSTLSATFKLVVAGLGGLTLIGWIANIEVLASLRANYIPMAPSTAVAFASLGTAMFIRTWGPRWRGAARTLAAIIATLALIKLFEFFLNRSFGIDEIFVPDPDSFGPVRKGRMSPITAINFLISCLAILACDAPRFRSSSGHLSTAVLAVSAVVLLGYIHGTPLLYGATIIPVALPTAVAFFLLALSVILDAGPQWWPLRAYLGNSAKSLLLRWFLPAVLAVAVVIDLLRVRVLHSVIPNPAVLSSISTMVFILAITALISQTARILGGRIDRAEAARNAAQASLEALNQSLEHTVETRTLELRLRNEQMEEELQMARDLQLAMLPKRFPTIPANALSEESLLGFFTFYFPTGAVSGDFFNIFPVSKTSVGVLVCDVMGHGVRAALVAGMMRALTEQNAESHYDPGEFLTRLNEGLHSILGYSGTTMFATGFVIIVNVATGRYSYASAGHPKPFHYRRSIGKTACLDGATGPALGLFKEARYITAEASIDPGDLLLLFTDGLFEVEAPDSTLYSHNALLEEVRKHSGLPAQEILDELVDEVRKFARGSPFEDDVCLVGIEYRKVDHESGNSGVDLSDAVSGSVVSHSVA